MLHIFISYRREDSAQTACLVYECLRQTFGKDNVYRDVESIKPGSDFRGAIREAVVNSDVMLVIIGPAWVATESTGKSRLEYPDDLVRMEVQMALESDSVRVIPVCIRGAKMPPVDSLPSVLKQLAYRQAVFIKRFRRDMARLINDLSHMKTSEVQAISADPPNHRTMPKWGWERGKRVAFTIGRYDGDLTKLLKLVTELTEIGVNDIRISDLRLGSIIITLVMPSKAAKHIVQAFNKNPAIFKKIGVVKIALSTYFHELLTWSGAFHLRGVDWSGENLNGIDLSGADLSGANLSGTTLDHAQLVGTNFSGSNLSKAKLWYAELRRAKLEEADLRNAYLVRAHMGEINLKGADLTGANLEDAFLFKSDLTRASLRKANLQNADLGAANIQSADMRGSNLLEADMRWTMLEMAAFDSDTVLFDGSNYTADINWEKYMIKMEKRMLSKQFVQSI